MVHQAMLSDFFYASRTVINIANQALHAEDVAMSAVRDFLCYGKWID